MNNPTSVGKSAILLLAALLSSVWGQHYIPPKEADNRNQANLYAAVVPAAEPRRVFIGLGNGAYRHAPALGDAPQKDVMGVASAFRARGYEIHCLYNAAGVEMHKFLGAELALLRPGDVVVVYLAGHGVNDESKNLFLAIDFDGGVPLGQAATDVNDLLKRIERATLKAPAALFADMCRSPLVTARGYLSTDGFLIPPSGAFIAFSSEAGHPSFQSGDRGFFSQFVEKELKAARKGDDLEHLVIRARHATLEKTKGKQRPMTLSTLDAGATDLLWPNGEVLIHPEPKPDPVKKTGSIERPLGRLENPKLFAKAVDKVGKRDLEEESEFLVFDYSQAEIRTIVAAVMDASIEIGRSLATQLARTIKTYAALGDIGSQRLLVRGYCNGLLSLERDLQQAAFWAKSAAASGDEAAVKEYAELLLSDSCFPANPSEAVKLIVSLLANSKDPDVDYLRGWIARDGLGGGKRDLNTAFHHFDQCAKSGSRKCAAAAAQLAMQIHPNDEKALRPLIMLAINLNSPELNLEWAFTNRPIVSPAERRSILDKLISHSIDPARAYIRRGFLSLAAGDLQAAESDLLKSTFDPRGNFSLANFYDMQGRYEDERRILQKLLEVPVFAPYAATRLLQLVDGQEETPEFQAFLRSFVGPTGTLWKARTELAVVGRNAKAFKSREGREDGRNCETAFAQLAASGMIANSKGSPCGKTDAKIIQQWQLKLTGAIQKERQRLLDSTRPFADPSIWAPFPGGAK